MHAVEDRMWWYRGLRTLAAALLGRALSSPSAPAAPVLDAGCGTGGMLARLAATPSGSRAMGLEFDAIAAGLAARKSGRPVVRGSANELPIGDGVLGGYVSLDVLCHDGVDPGRALAEARRCLAPGGVVLLNLPAYGWMLSAHDRRVQNVRRFTRRQANALVRAQGLRILRSTYWNTLLFPLMLLHRLIERDDNAASDVRDYPAWQDAVFSAALAAERAAIGAGLSLPFGGSLIVVAARDG
jgi:SAM-dependent methyltransferase